MAKTKLRAHDLMPLAKMRLTASEVSRLTGPCVYEFRQAGKILYVGSSANGLTRVLSTTHHRKELRRCADEVVVHWCESLPEAREIERQMILTFKPTGNSLDNLPQFCGPIYGRNR